jgi:hypothetical protein
LFVVICLYVIFPYTFPVDPIPPFFGQFLPINAWNEPSIIGFVEKKDMRRRIKEARVPII